MLCRTGPSEHSHLFPTLLGPADVYLLGSAAGPHVWRMPVIPGLTDIQDIATRLGSGCVEPLATAPTSCRGTRTTERTSRANSSAFVREIAMLVYRRLPFSAPAGQPQTPVPPSFTWQPTPGLGARSVWRSPAERPVYPLLLDPWIPKVDFSLHRHLNVSFRYIMYGHVVGPARQTQLAAVS